MTTVITRLFPDVASAKSAVNRLTFKGIPKRDCIVIEAGDTAESRMQRADVDASAIGPYMDKLATGAVALVVRATYKPLGAAQLTRDILEDRETIAVDDDVVEERFVKWKPDPSPSVLKGHPHMLLMHNSPVRGTITGSMGMSLLKSHREKRPLIKHGKPMSRMFWPMALLSKKSRSKSVMSGGRHISRAFWPAPLLSQRTRRNSVISGGGLPFSNTLGFKTTTSLR